MSIMVNSNKTPTGKTSKGKVSIYVEKGRIKARLPRQYFGGEQPRIALGMDANEANMARAQRLAERMTLDLQDGCFDESLSKYGIVADLKLKGNDATLSDNQLPPKPELSLLEIWDMYCQYKRHKLAETTYQLKFQGTFLNAIKDAIKFVGEEAIDIRNWMIANRCNSEVKKILSHLSHAYVLAIRQKKINFNPFDGMHEEIEVKRRKKIINQNDDNEDSDSDILNSTKSYTWDEALIILEYIQNSSRLKHWYPFIKFKFLTGCRTGEAIALWWNDVKWNDECIIIKRTYSYGLKIFKPSKNETKRIFPMPKNGELWNLLKSIPQGESNEVVFKSKQGKIIDARGCLNAWAGNSSQKGIIPTLIEQGKLNKYLPPYNTRHTFINHQINVIGIKESIVNAWCEHSEEISKKHYRDLDTKISPGYDDQQIQQQSELEILKEQLRQQQELINKLLAERDK